MAKRNSRPRGTVQYDNAGRIVLVTGGASGIGRGVAEAFHRSGARVVCLDLVPGEDLSDGIFFRKGDTSRRKDCEQAVEWVLSRFGGLDVLVNNAAVQPADSYRPIDEYTDELWQRMVDVNLTGYMQMARAVLPHMKTQQEGVIVNLASGQGHRTARGVPAYGPIKAANIMQTRQWGVEYARAGIRVVSVSPGAIDTPLVRQTLESQGGAEALSNRHPLGRIGTTAEVAHVVLWLSSDAASFVTATDVEVDGGLGAFGAFADPYPR
ncbi:MAG: SDR family NAD(P)-dependent oxidoreductase [Pirellulaceae bacterium]|nr:SDR family NAD(P)-dependent oxidoreductase [Pirellulaceae bacterium]